MIPGYRLSPSVHWCTTHGFSILLDIDSDKYFSIPARYFEALLAHLANGACSNAPGSRRSPSELARVEGDLINLGLLVREMPRKMTPQDADLPQATDLVPATETLLPVRTALPHAYAVIRACATADHLLRSKSLRHILSRIARSKETPGPIPAKDLIHLTRAFNTVRPLYPRNYLCLFDSLALLEFLSRWNMFPNWVFGVQIDPFEAHCWVQHHNTVLCDTHAFRARWYSRILVV